MNTWQWNDSGKKGYALYGPTGCGAISFWEVEQILAAARKRPVRQVFTKEGVTR